MSLPPWHEEPISKKHDRVSFDCGESVPNDFSRQHARKSHEAGGAKTFLAIADADGKTVLGFYSLSPASVEYARKPDIIKRAVTTCRASVLCGLPWPSSFSDNGSAVNYCCPRGGAV